MQEDTIAAIATPIGEGGIGIVRISGPRALEIVKNIFKAKYKKLDRDKSHKMIYGHVYNKRTGDIVDEVLVCYMKAPYSYTREDIVEINCHGGIIPLKETLELVLTEGARLAGPGEFSKRAFLNGRIDLAQAESIIDIIRSKTKTGLKLAVSQLKGDLSRKINAMQNKLLQVIAKVEVTIDFPEDDLEEATGKEIIDTAKDLIKQVESLIRGAETGIIYREGIKVAIIGKPNVGKSSLLNALLKEKRAIVTDVPGTTRDIIEEVINMQGIPLRIIDTAGLRETKDIVEKIGVEKTRDIIKKADLVLLVLDAADGLSAQDTAIMKLAIKKRRIYIVNKADVKVKKINQHDLYKFDDQGQFIWISAKMKTGLDVLEDRIVNMILSEKIDISENVIVANLRHKKALEKAALHLDGAISSIMNQVPIDIVAIDLREAWESLGEINGTAISENLIERIFQDFCVGK